MNVILDFCRPCGALLQGNADMLKDLKCLNCGTDIGSRETRIQGNFEPKDAGHLMVASGFDEDYIADMLRRAADD